MTKILSADVIPNGWLSLQVTPTPGAMSYLVTVDGDDHIAFPVVDLGFNVITGSVFLPKVTQVSGTVTVTVTPLDGDADPIGDESAPFISEWRVYSPERNIRQIVADSIANAAIMYDGLPVWVHFDRMGRPATLPDRVGRVGHAVEIGVTYMSSESPFADSDYTDTNITVPVRIFAKGDNPEAGQAAVDVAYLVRGNLTETLPLMNYGVSTWDWSGSQPEQLRDAWACEMTMTMTRISSQGVCS